MSRTVDWEIPGEIQPKPADCAFNLWCNHDNDAGHGVCAAKRTEGQPCTGVEACRGRCDIPKKPDGTPMPVGTCTAVCGSG